MEEILHHLGWSGMYETLRKPTNWNCRIASSTHSFMFFLVNSTYPKQCMYGIFTYIWLIFTVNVGKYSIRGLYGYMFTFLKVMSCHWPVCIWPFGNLDTYVTDITKQLLWGEDGDERYLERGRSLQTLNVLSWETTEWFTPLRHHQIEIRTIHWGCFIHPSSTCIDARKPPKCIGIDDLP